MIALKHSLFPQASKPPFAKINRFRAIGNQKSVITSAQRRFRSNEKELIAVIAVIVLGIAVDGVIVGLNTNATSLGTQATGVTSTVVTDLEAELTP